MTSDEPGVIVMWLTILKIVDPIATPPTHPTPLLISFSIAAFEQNVKHIVENHHHA
jgi:hypothetical protein